MILLGKDTDGHKVSLDIEKLIETRMLINATSGAGKSWMVRRILEQSYGKVQHIVLDLEGEFITLREKFDYLIAGVDGDVPLDHKTAGTLVEQIMENRISAILDMSEMKKEDRKPFVRKFIEKLMHLPKRLWEPLFVIIDEAHHFAPQTSKDESGPAVIDLITRGRKRFYCPILSTQRLAKVNKDACAELLNVFIGKTTLDVDQHRAAEYLGLSSREDRIGLRNLNRGDFHCFGEAVQGGEPNDFGIRTVAIGGVQTTHSKKEQRTTFTVPEPKGGLKKILDALKEQMAQKDIKVPTASAQTDSRTPTIFALQNKIRNLEIDVVKAQQKNTIAVVPSPQLYIEREKYNKLNAYCTEMRKYAGQLRGQIKKLFRAGDSIRLQMQAEFPGEYAIVKEPALMEVREPERLAVDYRPLVDIRTAPFHPEAVLNGDLTRPRLRILESLAELEACGINSADRNLLAALSGASWRSSAYGNNLGALRSTGFITPAKQAIALTDLGRAAVPGVKPIMSRGELHKRITVMLPKPRAAILDRLIDVYPDKIERNELALFAGASPTSSAYGNNLGSLRSMGLIEYPERNWVRATDLIFPEELA